MKKFVAAVTALTALAAVPAANAAVVGPTLASPSGQDVGYEQALTAPNGTVVTSWTATSGSQDGLFASRFSGGSFTQLPVLTDTSVSSVSYPRMAVSPAGVTTLVWLQRDPGSRQAIGQLKLRRVSAAGTPGPVVNLTNAGTRLNSWPAVVTDKSGNSTVVWADGTVDQVHPYLRGARVSAAGAKSATFNIAYYTGAKAVTADFIGAAVATNGTVGVIFGLEENQVQTLAYSRITNTKASTPATLNPAGTTGEQDYSRIESTPANGFRVAFLADAADTSVRLYTRAIDSRNKVGNALLAKIASAASGNWITDVSLGVDKNGQASIAWIEGTEVRFVRVTTKGKLAGAAQLNVSQTPSEGSLGLVTTAAGATSVVWTTPGATPATSSHDAYIEGRRISSAGVIGDLTRLADAPDGFGWLATRAGASAASNGTVTVVINGFHRGDSAATSFHGVFLVRWS